MIYSLVYISNAVDSLDEKSLQDILSTSRKSNQSLEVTGLLLYKEGEFMQVLEGDEDKITEIYQKISQDPRHQNCLILSRKFIPQRLFSDWSMGFQQIQNEAFLKQEGVSSFFEIQQDKENFLQNATAHNLLTRFSSQ